MGANTTGFSCWAQEVIYFSAFTCVFKCQTPATVGLLTTRERHPALFTLWKGENRMFYSVVLILNELRMLTCWISNSWLEVSCVALLTIILFNAFL